MSAIIEVITARHGSLEMDLPYWSEDSKRVFLKLWSLTLEWRIWRTIYFISPWKITRIVHEYLYHGNLWVILFYELSKTLMKRYIESLWLVVMCFLLHERSQRICIPMRTDLSFSRHKQGWRDEAKHECYENTKVFVVRLWDKGIVIGFDTCALFKLIPVKESCRDASTRGVLNIVPLPGTSTLKNFFFN